MIDLRPRHVTLWKNGRPFRSIVTPQPFGQERAKELWSKVRPVMDVFYNATVEEIAYVNAVWATLGGSSCRMDAFFEILNGRIEPPNERKS